MELTPTSTLDAINLLLATIGELPLNTLEECTFAEATTAKATLKRVSRNVQTTGLHSNSEYGVRLMPNSDGYIEIPVNTLMADPTDPTINTTIRGHRLYNLTDHTYQFDEAVELDLVYFLEFDELPEHVRWYVAVKAARQFQAQVLGSDTISQFVERDEIEARMEFRRIEGQYDDATLLDHPETIMALRRSF